MSALAIRVRELFNGLSDDQMRIVFAEYIRDMGRRDSSPDLDSTQDASVVAVDKEID